LLDLLDALDALAEMDEAELLEELLPELAALCRHKWLLKLILAYCDRR
jgi:hypothetical protein